MCSGECACGIVPFQGVFTKVSHRISQVSDIGGVGRHIVLGRFQLRTINGVGAGVRELASGDVSDFVGGVGAACSGECACGIVPFQGVFTEVSHRISQVSDISGVASHFARQVSDVGGVCRHIVLGRFQLRTVDGVGAGVREVASGDIGDFASGVVAMGSAVFAIGLVPLQSVFIKYSERIANVIFVTIF